MWFEVQEGIEDTEFHAHAVAICLPADSKHCGCRRPITMMKLRGGSVNQAETPLAICVVPRIECGKQN
jgi:hypothetical protein